MCVIQVTIKPNQDLCAPRPIGSSLRDPLSGGVCDSLTAELSFTARAKLFPLLPAVAEGLVPKRSAP
jgi:hypothetical protein